METAKSKERAQGLEESWVAELREKRVAGADEAGRGPLAGPVFAAAVILPQNHGIDGLGDSKALSAKKRQSLESAIKDKALAWAVEEVSAEEIDRINILQASLEGMRRAIERLEPKAEVAWLDGNQIPKGMEIPARALIGGDARAECIMAASILAKETRDRKMEALAKEYPGYGLEKHKGYPTKDHVAALERLGATPIHRKSFGPVKKALALQKQKESQ